MGLQACFVTVNLCGAFARVYLRQIFDTSRLVDSDETISYEYNFAPSAHCDVIEDIKVCISDQTRFSYAGSEHIPTRPGYMRLGRISRGNNAEAHVVYLVHLKCHTLNIRKFTLPVDIAPLSLFNHAASPQAPGRTHTTSSDNTTPSKGLSVNLRIALEWLKTLPTKPVPPTVQCTSHELNLATHLTSSEATFHTSEVLTGLMHNMVFAISDDLSSTNPRGWFEVFPTNPNIGDSQDPIASLQQTYTWSCMFQFTAPRACTPKGSGLTIVLDLQHDSNQVRLCKALKSRITQVPEYMTFNTLAYTPTLSSAFSSGLPRSNENIEQFVQFLSSITIPEKGCDLLTPLRAELSHTTTARQLLIFTDTLTEEHLGSIFLLCGELETRVIAFLVSEEKPQLSCGLRHTMKSQGNLTYCISSSCSTHNLKKAIDGAFLRVSDPVCVDAYLDWGSTAVTMIPKSLPPLFSSSVYTIVGYSSKHTPTRRPIVRLGCRSFSDNTDAWLYSLPFSGVTVLTAKAFLKQSLPANCCLSLKFASIEISTRAHPVTSTSPIVPGIGKGLTRSNNLVTAGGRIGRSVSAANPLSTESISHLAGPVNTCQIHPETASHPGSIVHSHSLVTSVVHAKPLSVSDSSSSSPPNSLSQSPNSPMSLRTQASRRKSVHGLFEIVPETFAYTLQMSLLEAYPMALHFAIQRIEELRRTDALSACDMELARSCAQEVIFGSRFEECLNRGYHVEPHCAVNCVQVREHVVAFLEQKGLPEIVKVPTLEAYAASKQGPRPSMEDYYIILPYVNHLYNLKQGHPPQSFYAIFDGHGGQFAAQYSRINLHHLIYSDPLFYSDIEQAITNAYLKTDRTFNLYAPARKLDVGCTAVTAMITAPDKLLVANVGDSEAVLCRAGMAVRLTTLHNPNSKTEKARVIDSGGCFIHWGTWRVNGRLAVTRSIGDVENEQVIADPAINQCTLTPEDEFLVLASDGLFDVIPHQEVVDIIRDLLEKNVDTREIPGRLVDAAIEKKTKDNTTVLIIFLKRTVNM